MDTGETVKTAAAHPGGVWALEACWEKKVAATGGDTHLKTWDLETLSVLQQIDGHPGSIMSLSMNFEESRAFVATADGGLQFWSLEAREAQKLQGHNGPTAHVIADWKKEHAVSGGWDGILKVWSISA